MRPVLFEIFGLKIYSFGAAICASFLFSFWITRVLIRRDRVDPLYPPDAPEEKKKAILEWVYDLGFGAMVGGVVGARLWHIFQPDNIGTYVKNPMAAFKVWEGGLVFYGGFIGAFFTCLAMVLRKRIPPWQMGDFAAPGISFAYGIGRLGCFLNGCCYGTQVDWGLEFPSLHDHVHRHPTQLYEFGAAALTGFLLIWLLPRRTWRGQVFWLYVMLAAVARFAVEFIRDDPRGGLGSLSTSQWIAVVAFPVALAMWLRLKNRNPIRPAPAGA
ncbi:MAG: prolipoprotein diacylglyceryl transferase [Planctomycetes bacterium]|nr:prolipoprotein diacylglyceryl transferase [Planctomycetota bacterium]